MHMPVVPVGHMPFGAHTFCGRPHAPAMLSVRVRQHRQHGVVLVARISIASASRLQPTKEGLYEDDEQ